MSKTPTEHPFRPLSEDPLTAAYHEAISSLVTVIGFGRIDTIRKAFRTVLMTKIALLRAAGTPDDEQLAVALEAEMALVDAQLARSSQAGN